MCALWDKSGNKLEPKCACGTVLISYGELHYGKCLECQIEEKRAELKKLRESSCRTS